jgi:hypothetical protein
MHDKSASFVKGNGLRLLQDDGGVEPVKERNNKKNIDAVKRIGMVEHMRKRLGMYKEYMK